MDYSEVRRSRLLREGFSPAQSQYYSTQSIDNLGMRKLRRYMHRQYKAAQEAGITDAQYQTYVRESWEAQGISTPEQWHDRAFDELMKPYKERQSLLIHPDIYNQYKAIRNDTKLSPSETYKLINQYSPTEWIKREQQYRQLINTFHTPEEATRIVYAWTRDGQLQSLDLNNAAWQVSNQERTNWYRDYVRNALSRGLTRQEAYKAAMQEINDKMRTDKELPWANLDLISPKGPVKPRVDFIGAAMERQKRLDRQRKEQLPFRVAR